jgi:E3 ubiquitin-protein ligase HECTD2
MCREFWKLFKDMQPTMQRKLLTFVTGSDRIPATGTARMRFQITCGGTDCDRLPTAHTCFNQLILFRYTSAEKLKWMIELAITESQGFYVK